MSASLLRCQRCREFRDRDLFPVKASNMSGRRGVCVVCEPLPAPKPKAHDRYTAAQKERMCSRKTKYPSKRAAISAALRSARRADLIRMYHCPVCSKWHLTSKADKRVAS